METDREKSRLAFHGSFRGVDVLGLDVQEYLPNYQKWGICYVGLGETPESVVYFADFSTAYRYANNGCMHGGIVFGVDPDEAKLEERAKDFWQSNGRVSKEHIRLVMIPTAYENMDKMFEVAKKTKRLLPNADVLLYPIHVYYPQIQPPIKDWDGWF